MSLSLQAVRALKVGVFVPETQHFTHYFNKVLLLSHHMPSEPDYPVIDVLPDYDPDLAMGVRIRAKNVINVFHCLADVEGKKLGVVNISLKDAAEEEVFLYLSDESYGKFLQFLPKMLLPDTLVTVCDKLCPSLSEHCRNILKFLESKSGLSGSGTLHESLLTSYVRFLMSSPMNKEQLREKMRPGALLSLLYTLGLTDVEVVRTVVGSFIQLNKCHLPHCPHFSRLRCEGCHVVHYCDTKCQVGLL